VNGELLSNLLTVFVYLVHHGDAVSAAVDSQRPLSGQGREQVEALAKQAVTQQVRPAVIWHSGKLRARQTALAFRQLTQTDDEPRARWFPPKGVVAVERTETGWVERWRLENLPL
jgi:phosphohistidine phosphatase SixA